MSDVYYQGTKEQWDSIEIGNENEYLINATIHFGIEPHEHTYSHCIVTATCVADGTEYDICSVCGKIINSKTIPAKGHSYGDWITMIDADCTNQGLKCRICDECYEIEQQYTPFEHVWSEWEIVVEPSVSEEGLKQRKCTRCGATEEEIIPCLIPVEKVAFEKTSQILLSGSKVKLNVIITPSDSTNHNLIWTSTDNSVVTVENGFAIAGSPGTAVIMVKSEDGNKTALCSIHVVEAVPQTPNIVIDKENGLIYGISCGENDINDYLSFSEEGVTFDCGSPIIGTGTTVSIFCKGVLIEEFSAVIFGDTNGDGWYDGTDSVIVNCLANGLLTKEQVGEAVYIAADCNHDDVIDENDVALLEQAGIILAGVDQSKSPEELVTDSAYVEYLNLIDQNPTVETPVEEATDVTPTNEPVDEGFSKSFIQRIIDFVIYIVNLMKSFIAKF